MTPLRQRMMEDLQIRNYAPSTVKAYVRGVADFAKHFGKSPDRLGAEQIREYQLFLIKEKGIALPTYIQIVSGLRFLYTNTLHRQIGIERMPFPRYERKLPIIMSREEVKALLEAPKNLGHRTILSTMYAAGPRISEAAHLKIHSTVIFDGDDTHWRTMPLYTAAKERFFSKLLSAVQMKQPIDSPNPCSTRPSGQITMGTKVP